MLSVNKNEAITKLNRLIEDGRQNAGQVIEHVMTHQPQDYIVKANGLQFSSNAISWVGGQEPDAEKKLELMKLAGRVLLPGKGGEIPFAVAEVVQAA